MSIRTLSPAGCTYVVQRATLSTASRAAESRQYWQSVDAAEGTAEWFATETECVATEADALSAGIRYVSAWQSEQTDKRKAHAWNTVGHLESCQPFSTLSALACMQQVDHYSPATGKWTTEYLPLTRTGKVDRIDRATRKAITSKGGSKSSRALRADGKAMTQSERKAESKANGKWRAVAAAEGYVCSQHGPVASQPARGKGRCATACRKAALALTESTEPVAVAESADRGW